MTAGAVYGNYQEALRSPMTLGGMQASPEWMVATHVHLLGLSIIAILLSFIIDDIFESYRDVVAVVFVLGQWLEPLSVTVAAGLGIGIFGLVGQVTAATNLLVLAAFLVNYLRNGLGTAGE